MLAVAMTIATLPGPAIAAKSSDQGKCQRAIAKAVTKLFKTQASALKRCEEAKVKGKHGDACPDGGTPPGSPGRKAADALAKAVSKLTSAIDKSCGGADKRCGTADDADNPFTPADIGFDMCPTFEGGCAGAITDCSGIATCLACLGTATAEQVLATSYADLVPSDSRTEKKLNKCQVTIGKATIKYALAKEQALAKCWDSRFKGRHSAECPDPSADPKAAKDAVKAAETIAKAESKKIAAICKACGGDDKACDQAVTTVSPGLPASLDGSNAGDDLTPAVITDLANCPSVLLPAKPGRPVRTCARPIDTLADLVFCADCVTEFQVDCLDPTRVPALETYPQSACAIGACPETQLGSMVPVSQAGSTTGGPSVISGACGGSGPERVFRWTPPATDRFQISTVDAGTNFNTVLALRDLNCAGDELSCNDDQVGVQARLNLLPAIGGRSLGIVVDGAGGASGNFVLHITQLPAAGSCCAVNSPDNPGCNVASCQSCVCGQDSSCCDDTWGAACAARAADQCGAICLGCASAGTCPKDSNGQQLLCANGTCHCPFTCEGWNPAGGNCAGAPLNVCGGGLDNTGIACTLP